MSLVIERLGNSLKLVSAAFMVIILVNVPLGLAAAWWKDRVPDRVALTVAVLGQSVPPFFSGILAILIFGVWLRWFPIHGNSTPLHYVLPAVTMGLFTGAGVTRLLRSSMIEVLDTEYVKFGRSKGITEREILFVHSLKNAGMPVLTFMGLMYGVLIAAAVSTEVVFSWPGMGRLAYEAVIWRDFPVLQAVVIVWAIVIAALSLLVDGLYLVMDPRMRRRSV